MEYREIESIQWSSNRAIVDLIWIGDAGDMAKIAKIDVNGKIRTFGKMAVAQWVVQGSWSGLERWIGCTKGVK